MLGSEDEKGQNPCRKTYLRSVSWSCTSPNKPNISYSRAQPSSKARACLPPLQPLSISRRNAEEWPKAGSDDLGVWPQATTPGGRSGCGLGLKPVSGGGSSNVEVKDKEFESNKERLAFFEKECSRIVDHIYLGSEVVAKNREVLRQNGITHVLNCVGSVCPEFFRGDLVYKTLWLQDSPSEDITSILYDVFDYFEEVREVDGRVLVHCSQGVSRSTSLVIAYLMWSKAQSFDEAFQYVKAARGVTNPNMGFACQLLQCQKRVHALPFSPNSLLRMYRMAPHSSYDPLHLVPKLLSQPGENGLDSRGAFLVHVSSALYVWIGKYCSSTMSENANLAAQQVVKYERANGPILTIKEGEEPTEFWDALSRVELMEGHLMNPDGVRATIIKGNRKVNEYDPDFDIFQRALDGGVVPPFMSSVSASETCLPSRENGWGKLRDGLVKKIMLSPSMNIDNTQSSGDFEPIQASTYDMAEPVSPTAHLVQSIPTSSNICERFARPSELSYTSLSPCSSPDPFVSHHDRNPTCNSKSPSLSPSTSDSSSTPFTFSPSSSNWSDSSNHSSHPSPSAFGFCDPLFTKNLTSVDDNCIIQNKSSGACIETFSVISEWKSSNLCPPCKGASPSIAQRRGGKPPTLMLQSSVEPVCIPRTLVKSWSFSLSEVSEEMMDTEMN